MRIARFLAERWGGFAPGFAPGFAAAFAPGFASALRHRVLRQAIALGLGIAIVCLPLWLHPHGDAAELQAIQRRGHLTVAVKDNVRPLGFRDGAGQLAGLEIDLARRLAEALFGQPDAVVFEPVTNQERIPALLNGDVDLVIARMSLTGPRARLVDFSAPYYIDGTGIVTSDPSVQRLADLSGRAVAVLEGSSTIATVRSLVSGVRLVGVRSYQDAYNLLEAGRAIAFAADASVLTGWVQEYPRYRLLSSFLSAESLSVAMPKGLQHDDLRRRVNEVITQVRQDGWLRSRIEYWGLPEAGHPTYTQPARLPLSPP